LIGVSGAAQSHSRWNWRFLVSKILISSSPTSNRHTCGLNPAGEVVAEFKTTQVDEACSCKVDYFKKHRRIFMAIGVESRVFTMKDNQIVEAVVSEIIETKDSKRYLCKTRTSKFYAKDVFETIDELTLNLSDNARLLTDADYNAIISTYSVC
jgi:hypothetical protein